MKVFSSLAEVEAELAKHIPMVKHITGQQVTLERIAPLMALVGNPQDSLRIIHLAGTSGKTSTAYYLASLLQSGGKKVGLTISPHVDSLTERVQINLQPLSESVFCQALSEFMELIKDAAPAPTYFEILVAFAYWYFVKVGVDYAVVETGLGGLHDGTNIAQRPDKVCVITDIGFDHMHILGSTLERIAEQKAGIIHPHNPVFMYRQAPEVMEVFETQAQRQQAKLTLFEQADLKQQFPVKGLDLLPLYQQHNWLLARAVSEAVTGDITPDQIAASLLVQVPGRMDEWQAGDKTIVMDGAHNEQKMRAFVESFQEKHPGTKAAILLSLKEGKEYEAVLPLLKPICARLVITTFQPIQDVPTPAIETAVLAKAAEAAGLPHIQTIDDPTEAYKAFIQSPEEVLVITGSFYLLSCVRPLIMKS